METTTKQQWHTTKSSQRHKGDEAMWILKEGAGQNKAQRGRTRWNSPKMTKHLRFHMLWKTRSLSLTAGNFQIISLKPVGNLFCSLQRGVDCFVSIVARPCGGATLTWNHNDHEAKWRHVFSTVTPFLSVDVSVACLNLTYMKRSYIRIRIREQYRWKG